MVTSDGTPGYSKTEVDAHATVYVGPDGLAAEARRNLHSPHLVSVSLGLPGEEYPHAVLLTGTRVHLRAALAKLLGALDALPIDTADQWHAEPAEDAVPLDLAGL